VIYHLSFISSAKSFPFKQSLDSLIFGSIKSILSKGGWGEKPRREDAFISNRPGADDSWMDFSI
jgi:hypothetical protein